MRIKAFFATAFLLLIICVSPVFSQSACDERNFSIPVQQFDQDVDRFRLSSAAYPYLPVSASYDYVLGYDQRIVSYDDWALLIGTDTGVINFLKLRIYISYAANSGQSSDWVLIADFTPTSGGQALYKFDDLQYHEPGGYPLIAAVRVEAYIPFPASDDPLNPSPVLCSIGYCTLGLDLVKFERYDCGVTPTPTTAPLPITCGSYTYPFYNDSYDWAFANSSWYPLGYDDGQSVHTVVSPFTGDNDSFIPATVIAARLDINQPLRAGPDYPVEVSGYVYSGNHDNKVYSIELYDDEGNALPDTGFTFSNPVPNTWGYGSSSSEPSSNLEFSGVRLRQHYDASTAHGTLWDSVTLNLCGGGAPSGGTATPTPTGTPPTSTTIPTYTRTPSPTVTGTPPTSTPTATGTPPTSTPTGTPTVTTTPFPSSVPPTATATPGGPTPTPASDWNPSLATVVATTFPPPSLSFSPIITQSIACSDYFDCPTGDPPVVQYGGCARYFVVPSPPSISWDYVANLLHWLGAVFSAISFNITCDLQNFWGWFVSFINNTIYILYAVNHVFCLYWSIIWRLISIGYSWISLLVSFFVAYSTSSTLPSTFLGVSTSPFMANIENAMSTDLGTWIKVFLLFPAAVFWFKVVDIIVSGYYRKNVPSEHQ